MGMQIYFHIAYPLFFLWISFIVDLWSTIPSFSLQRSYPFFPSFFFFCCSLPYVLLSSWPTICLSVSFFLPPHFFDWLEWVKRDNLFSQGLKLPGCLFGCGEAQMIYALPSGTTAHVVQNQHCLHRTLQKVFAWRNLVNCRGLIPEMISKLLTCNRWGPKKSLIYKLNNLTE